MLCRLGPRRTTRSFLPSLLILRVWGSSGFHLLLRTWVDSLSSHLLPPRVVSSFFFWSLQFVTAFRCPSSSCYHRYNSCAGPFVNPIFGDINSYPLLQPLFAYYDDSPDAYDAQRNEFLCFLISPQGQQIVNRAGYFGISSDKIAAAETKLLCKFDGI